MNFEEIPVDNILLSELYAGDYYYFYAGEGLYPLFLRPLCSLIAVFGIIRACLLSQENTGLYRKNVRFYVPVHSISGMGWFL